MGGDIALRIVFFLVRDLPPRDLAIVTPVFCHRAQS